MLLLVTLMSILLLIPDCLFVGKKRLKVIKLVQKEIFLPF